MTCCSFPAPCAHSFIWAVFSKEAESPWSPLPISINFGIFLMSTTTPWIIFWNISNHHPGWLALHQDTHPHGPANILFWIFMECIHGYLGCSPPLLEYYLTLFGNDSNYLGCLPAPHTVIHPKPHLISHKQELVSMYVYKLRKEQKFKRNNKRNTKQTYRVVL